MPKLAIGIGIFTLLFLSRILIERVYLDWKSSSLCLGMDPILFLLVARVGRVKKRPANIYLKNYFYRFVHFSKFKCHSHLLGITAIDRLNSEVMKNHAMYFI